MNKYHFQAIAASLGLILTSLGLLAFAVFYLRSCVENMETAGAIGYVACVSDESMKPEFCSELWLSGEQKKRLESTNLETKN